MKCGMMHQPHRKAVILGQAFAEPFQSGLVGGEDNHSAELNRNRDHYVRILLSFDQQIID